MNAPAEVIDNTCRLCKRCGQLVAIAHFNNVILDHRCHHGARCSGFDPPCEKCETDKAPAGYRARPPGDEAWSNHKAATPQFGQDPTPRKAKPTEPTPAAGPAPAAKPVQPSLFGEPDSLPPPKPAPGTRKDLPRKAKHAAGSETSHAAADSLSGAVLNDLQLKVLEAIIDSKGLTCDEVELQLGLRHQTASARINELIKGAYVEDAGERRNTTSGRKATVWQATNKAKGS